MGGQKSKHTLEQAEPRVIVVFGATGAQGGSVARALLENPGFKVKAVTRNPESEKAQALKEAGAELVTADLDDAESVQNALDGAYGVFAVTNYWAIMDQDKEIAQGKAIADACKEKGISHLVYSGLEDVNEAIGKPCPHFDSKSLVMKHIKEIGVPSTTVFFSFYYENLLDMMKPSRNDDDSYTVGIPMEGKPMDMVVVSETGQCIVQIFKAGKKYFGKSVGLSSNKATIEEYAAILSKHLEKTFKAGEITTEQFGELGFPGAKDFAVMFEYYQSGKLDRDVKLTRQLNPKISDFDTWVENNKDALLAALE